MPAFGLDGPWRDRVGFAQTMEQVSGIAWRTAYPESEGESAGPLTPRAGTDPLAGLHAAFAALLAVRHRVRSERGSHVESVMVETTLGVSAEQVAEYSASGTLLTGEANRSPYAAPQGLYACEGLGLDGGPIWLAISITSEGQWHALARSIGHEAWTNDARLATLEGRREAHDEIDAAIAAWSARRPVTEAVEILLRAGVPAAEAIGPRHAQELEPIAESGFVETVEHPVVGRVPVAAIPIRFGRRSNGWFDRAAPTLGEHNHEVLTEVAGVDEARLATLARDGLLGDRPKGL